MANKAPQQPQETQDQPPSTVGQTETKDLPVNQPVTLARCREAGTAANYPAAINQVKTRPTTEDVEHSNPQDENIWN